jgi:Undecaprenyl-phosphate galactose phosphotransferase WbaP
VIKQSTYTQSESPHLPRPLDSFFEVDDRIREETARVDQGAEYERAPSNSWKAAIALMMSDLLALYLALAACSLIALRMVGTASTLNWMPIFLVVWIGGLAVSRSYPGWGTGPVQRLRAQARSMLAACTTSLMTAVAGGGQWQSAALLIGASAVTGLLFLAAGRRATRAILARNDAWGVKTVFYGTTESARRIIQVVQTQKEIGFRPIGIFEDDPGLWGHELAGVPVLGDTGLVHPDAPVAVVAGLGGPAAHRRMDALLRYYRRVIVVPDLVDQSTAILEPMDFGGLLGLQLQVNLSSTSARAVKRLSELAATAITLPLWGTVVALGALAVWCEDRQNPFYSQIRIGRRGRSIRVLKLRTMVPDAEAVLEQALADDENLRIEWEATSKLQKDPRITAVGRVLRRLSIDELPQLVNVLRGDMALIGPRPLPEYHEKRLSADARDLRRWVRPGATGLWQVSGRSDTGDYGISWLDAYYVRNWSIWLDLAILLRTFRAAIGGSGAY